MVHLTNHLNERRQTEWPRRVRDVQNETEEQGCRSKLSSSEILYIVTGLSQISNVLGNNFEYLLSGSIMQLLFCFLFVSVI